MKKLLLVCFILLIGCIINVAISKSTDQVTRIITGTVVDENRETIPGASIIVKGTSTGTVTDIDGKFSLQVSSSQNIIVVSFIGYTSQEIVIDSKTDFTIILKEDNQLLSEVVVVGYGTQKKASLTGSVSSISSKNSQKNKDKKASTWKRSGMTDNSIRLQVGDNDFIPLEAAQMAVQIDGFRVRILMDCFFFNNKKNGIEGTFKLKLPTDATPYYFAFGETEYMDEENNDKQIKGKQIPYVKYDSENFNLSYKGIEDMNDREWDDVKEARIVSKQKAAKAYEQTVSANIDPALMEWGGADMFSCRVFPLAMNKLHRIVIGYDLNMTEALNFREFNLSLPQPEKDLKIDIAAYNSSSLPLEIMPAIQPKQTIDNRVYYSLTNPKEKELLIHYNSVTPVILDQTDDDDPKENNAYFGANYRVQLPEEMQEQLPTDAVFMLDVSLSSNPDKFNVWLKLMEEILSKNRDIIKRFAVVSFNIDNFWYGKYYQKNNSYNVHQFLKYANSLNLEGATNISSALNEASNPSWLKNNAAKHIFLMSDGDYNWGEINKHVMIAQLNKGDRIHTYKSGLSGTNTAMLDFLSSSSGGFSFTVTGEEEVALTAKSFRFRPWKIENIKVEGVEDFLISGAPTQLYNGQKLIFSGRGTPKGNIQIRVNNGKEVKTLVFDKAERIKSILSSRIYGQLALAYLDSYGFKAEEAATSYSTYYRIPGQYTSFLMLESSYDYDQYGIDDSDAEDFVEENIVKKILNDFETQEVGLSLGNSKANFIAWLDKLSDKESIISLNRDADFNSYLKSLPDSTFSVRLNKISLRTIFSELQTSTEQELLSDEDLRFDSVFKLAKARRSKYGKGDGLKLLSSVVERNAADIQAIRDIAMVATDWGMGDQAYYMMKRIMDWRQGEALAYQTAANALAKSGNIDMAIIHYYICLNADWESDYGSFESIAALQCLNFINKISNSNAYQLSSITRNYLKVFKKQVEEILKNDNLLINKSDIVVIVNWNVDNTDIDLHVIEPSGEECYYAHNKTKSGGQLTIDVTNGYGPEMYVLEKAPAGIYKVKLNYYRVSQTKTASKAKAYIDVYRNWGRINETVTRKTILLNEVKDKKDVVTFRVK